MKRYTKLTIHVALIIIYCCSPSLIFAQGDPGGDPDVVPVDGGLTFLAAAGIAYGIKKLRDNGKKNNEEPSEE